MTAAPTAAQRPRGLGCEIAAVLVIKTLALVLIWWAWFSQPAPKAALPASTESLILAPQVPAASPSREDGHAAR